MRGFVLVRLFVFALLFMGQYAWSLGVSPIFGPSMVLQRDSEIPVWGTATPGSEVIVEIDGELGCAKKSVIADEKGAWRVVLPPMEAGGPVSLSVAGDDDTLLFKNILVGDVWVCSGQSNMQFWMKNSENANAEIQTAGYRKIRLFFSNQRVLPQPDKNAAGKWYVCSPTYVPKFSAVAYYFGKTLHQQLEVPIGLINASRGGTPITAWMSDEILKLDPDFAETCRSYEEALKVYPEEEAVYNKEIEEFNKKYPAYQDFLDAIAEAKQKGEVPPTKPSLPHLSPGGLWQQAGCYNAYIYPLSDFNVKGVIWYQGENDVSIAHLYRKLLPAMIKDWRNLWNQNDLPFGVVQLPNYGKTFSDCRDNQWAELREAQFLTSLANDNVGLATTIDIGDSMNLHPTNKRDVGIRLASWALSKVYDTPTPCEGPVYTSFEVEGNRVRIHFQDAEDSFVSTANDGKTLAAFQIAGADRKFFWADAELDGDTVVVWSSEVERPVAVRYAWEYSPEVNFFTESGLPAVPFRTDDWSGATTGVKVNPRFKTRFK